ncbi:MAG: flavodoxin-dependent (E)-4-hydroxy-3-methylbut-2-enyl-diphosphate synthase [Clostridiales bacterium]|nr:flavodoxin-dependent (E)-4-hydroxy-3-methylbut-2-enyl-diphosphate synthase [Clostridiales bacterium]
MTKAVKIGNRIIGGGNPILVQSMTNTDTRDVAATVSQIRELEAVGCDIVRVAVFDRASAAAVRSIVDAISIPLVADVHFDYKLALAAMENGVHKLRFNPGNIGGEKRVREIVACAKTHGVPIRVGVNAGSLETGLRDRYPDNIPEAMAQSALSHVAMLETEGFTDIVLALKASSVATTVAANRLIAARCDYPLHIGVTEAGAGQEAVIKSAVGIGALLLDGVGDTIRVSLTDHPVREVEAGKQILAALGLSREDVEIVSCPTCGRTRVDLLAAVEFVRANVPRNRGYLKIAVMGCAVNGPGEARDADMGIACGDGNAVLFEKGEIVASGELDEMLRNLAEKAAFALAK